MAYNETTTEEVRQELADVQNVEEKKMFGGIAFMVNNKMCICVGGSDPDTVMVRVGKDAYENALKRHGAKPTIMNGRVITGYINFEREGQKDLRSWIEIALKHNQELTNANMEKK